MREFLLFGKGFTKVDQWQEGCWINVSDPNQDDFTYLEEMGVPESFISDIRDPNERPRVEKDDDWMLTIMRIPRETGDVDIPFSTVPLGVITNGDLVIVLCYFKNIVIHDFIQYNTAKGNAINNKFALILRLIMSSAVWFLKFLKQINISINNTEDGLERRLRNDDLLKLRNLQKSLVYFNTGIRGNEALISRLRTIYMNSEMFDMEMVEDVHIEMQQALNMVSIYSNILTGSMEAFGSIISNNLNLIMKRMTSITIILQVPTLIASLYGMNVSLPIDDKAWAFVAILLLSMALSCAAFFVFKKIKWF
ncbi:MAG: magnesium transporter CorA family protein [Sodaliphilus sp.]|nr:magnesium transporter CorA family protein [Sodaliphilus sp.]